MSGGEISPKVKVTVLITVEFTFPNISETLT